MQLVGKGEASEVWRERGRGMFGGRYCQT